ncbi:hypothetical protein BDV96DRAFT_362109 [Lophiotrema nucula]|uniref:Uncharacterized protein n=1 Tax=Lophiotrema nucula TaxID=690887 RepID=A0A6A5ZGY2_9PLEO|nr:hypothetical protein BDV96DRAFT_362109 [Lophiotrema nucula]
MISQGGRTWTLNQGPELWRALVEGCAKSGCFGPALGAESRFEIGMGYREMRMPTFGPFGDLCFTCRTLSSAVLALPFAMSPAMLSRVLFLLLLSNLGLAVYVRDLPLLNTTTTLSVRLSTESTPTEKPLYKPHLEFSESITGFGPQSTPELEPTTTEAALPSTTGSDESLAHSIIATETESRAHKPHVESSAAVTGLEPDEPTRKNGYFSGSATTSVQAVSTDSPDVGGIISSYFKPSSNFAHIESTASGLRFPTGAATTTAPSALWWQLLALDEALQHIDSSTL